MRRNKAFKRGRVLAIVVAGFAGYVIGGWNGSIPHSSQLSASQTVALRFMQDVDDAATTTMAAATTTLGNAQFALLSPRPMVPQASDQQAAAASIPIPQASASPPSAPQARMQFASAEATVPAPQPVARPSKIAVATAAVRRVVNERPGFVLNDAQIASIRERLHLTSDQEEMWPAVEAALRNLAYARAREARRHGTPATAQQIASADPNGTDVQDLKSAAIPLIMSFNSEQKDEVRNIAHVMGLDQLANQF
jgi:hypothetical protein